ncbi:MAG: Trk system potassium transporter TrkA [Solirubrobacterales bacterium]|nr:Trk system potassium transporter TrkA [Solirubrobacterales bacterium]
MRVIVVGLGEVGQNVVRTLSAQRHEVTAVDADRERVEALQGDLDALLLAGNGASPKFLQEVGVGEADLLCAVTQSDEVNVIAALAGRQLGVRRTVARVRDEEYFGGDDEFSREVLGIDFVVQPEKAAADHLAEAVDLPGAVQVEHFADGRVTVAEAIVTPRSPLAGAALRDRRMDPPHVVMGIIRDGRTMAAEPGHRVKEGDHLLVAAAREDIATAIARTAGEAVEVRDVVIFGADRTGIALARRLLASRLRVVLMERDGDRARAAAEALPGATVLHEEGVGRDDLIAAGVDRAGAFAACSGDDRANLLAAMYAKQIGVGLALAIVSREEFVPLVDALGIDAAVSPRLVTAEAILRSVRGERVQALRLLLGGAEVLEVEAEPGCRAEGRRIEQADSMGHTHVAALVRDGKVILADDDHRVQAGDRVLVFSPRTGLSDVRHAFEAA